MMRVEVRQQGVAAIRRNADARAEQLRDVLSEFTGQSANATAAALNARGIPTARGGRWSARSIIDTRERLAR
jgi:hypothetical protein